MFFTRNLQNKDNEKRFLLPKRMPTKLKIIAARQILRHYHYICTVCLLQFDFILGLNFVSFVSNTLTHYHTLPYLKQKETKFKPRIKLNHNRKSYAGLAETWIPACSLSLTLLQYET